MLGVMTQLELEGTDAYRLTEQIDVWPWDEVMGAGTNSSTSTVISGSSGLPTEESAALYNLSSHGQTMADKCYVRSMTRPPPTSPMI